MNCEQISEHLADYVGRELDPRERLAFEMHLEKCTSCSNEVRSLQETVAALERLQAPPPRAAFPASARLRRLQALSYAAMLFIGLGVGWWIKPAHPPGSRSIERPPAAEVQDAATGTHGGGSNAAVATRNKVHGASRFARNTVRLVRALSGG